MTRRLRRGNDDERPDRCWPAFRRRIALLETREAERLGQMLREQGAEVVSVPAVAIVDAADPAPVVAWIERFIAGPADYLVLLTGEGLTRLHGLATQRRHRPPISSRRSAARRRSSAARSRRGPCARSVCAAAARRAGRPPRASSRCCPASICAAGASACSFTRTRRAALSIFSTAAGALPDPVIPYEYAAAASDDALAGLIEQDRGRRDRRGRLHQRLAGQAPVRTRPGARRDGPADGSAAAHRYRRGRAGRGVGAGTARRRPDDRAGRPVLHEAAGHRDHGGAGAVGEVPRR